MIATAMTTRATFVRILTGETLYKCDLPTIPRVGEIVEFKSYSPTDHDHDGSPLLHEVLKIKYTLPVRGNGGTSPLSAMIVVDEVPYQGYSAPCAFQNTLAAFRERNSVVPFAYIPDIPA